MAFLVKKIGLVLILFLDLPKVEVLTPAIRRERIKQANFTNILMALLKAQWRCNSLQRTGFQRDVFPSKIYKHFSLLRLNYWSQMLLFSYIELYTNFINRFERPDL